MRTRTVQVALPAEVVDALDGECRRLLQRRSQVLADVLREALPRRLSSALAEVSVLDVEGSDVEELAAR